MTGKPIRVLQVLRVLNRAGIETWLMHLLRHFDRREIAIDFLVQAGQPGAYDAEARSLGAKILSCPSARDPLAYGRNFIRILREQGPYDVVHSHNYFFSGFDLRLATMAGAGTRIAHLHPVRDILADRPFRSLYRRAMVRWIRDCSDVVLAPSYASLEAFSEFADLSSKPCYVMRNCVDLRAYRGPLDRADTRQRLGLPLDVPLIVYVARFEPHKNHALVADVADRLRDLGVAAHFALAGADGAARQAFQERIAGRANFSVFVDLADVAPLLRCGDLFLFPSTEEGFGTVAIEAAAAGLPVIATDLPGIREACGPAQRALMFEQDDAKSAAQTAQSILADPARAKRIGDEARQWAAQFSIETVAAQLAELYRGKDAHLDAVSVQSRKDAR